jgi:phosphatidylethanolamine-binding protein (PEBP) family uncharacterized protein
VLINVTGRAPGRTDAGGRGRLLGANISPALNWTQPPAGTAELVLIVEDPDVPIGKPATHALTLGIDPSLNGIPENALANPSPIPGIRHGKGTLGRRGWAGPLRFSVSRLAAAGRWLKSSCFLMPSACCDAAVL